MQQPSGCCSPRQSQAESCGTQVVCWGLEASRKRCGTSEKADVRTKKQKKQKAFLPPLLPAGTSCLPDPLSLPSPSFPPACTSFIYLFIYLFIFLIVIASLCPSLSPDQRVSSRVHQLEASDANNSPTDLPAGRSPGARHWLLAAQCCFSPQCWYVSRTI